MPNRRELKGCRVHPARVWGGGNSDTSVPNLFFFRSRRLRRQAKRKKRSFSGTLRLFGSEKLPKEKKRGVNEAKGEQERKRKQHADNDGTKNLSLRSEGR